jgi:membrane protein YqaA with SNARE-associated domain
VHSLVLEVFAGLLHLGAFGLIILGVLDSSFLFLPVGNDLLLVALVAENHQQFLVYVLAGSLGSVAGVALLDLVCRKSGEEGLKKMMTPRRLAYLKNKMQEHAGVALIIACLAPPPFPFTTVVAAASALQYPRLRLLGTVLGARAIRFSLIGLAAIWLNREILRIANSSKFAWFMAGFSVLCVVGSTVSIVRWVRLSRSKPRRRAAA